MLKDKSIRLAAGMMLLPAILALIPVAPASDCTKTSVGLIPLIDLGTGTYQGKEGGLYPGGSNTRPPAHERAGIEIARSIVPLDADGTPDPANGKIVLVSIGMSNTTQEFSTFKPMADADPDKNPKLSMVDGAQGGMTAAIISNLADSRAQQFWTTVDNRLRAASLTPAQVQVAWIKEANAQPSAAFPADAVQLQAHLAEIARILKARYPNIRIAYLSSRIYAGYASSALNPEPYAYQSGFAVKWVIEDQIGGASTLNFNPDRGQARSPWLAWGPYLWADGLKPRSDGLTYTCSDLNPSDGTHPATGARAKVSRLLLDFFKTDSTAKPWFLRPEKRAGSSLFFPALTARGGNPYDTAGATFTGLAVANLDSVDSILTFTAYDRAGNVITGPDIANPRQWPEALPAGAQLPRVDLEVFGAGIGTESQPGWFRLDAGASMPAGFFLIFDGPLKFFDGIDVSARTMSAFVLPELEPDGFTEIHVVNPNAVAANVQIDFMQSNGMPRAPSAIRYLAGYGAMVETVTDLFPAAAAAASDYVSVRTSQGVTACALLGKPDRYLKALGGQDVGAGATVLYSPQYAVGGAWRSTLSVVNLDAEPGTITLAFTDRTGQVLASRALDIQPLGKIWIDAQDFFVLPGAQVTEGHLTITSDGIRLAGSASFCDQEDSLASALPLVSELQKNVVFSQLASNETYYTGIAIVNPNAAEAQITVQVFANTGQLLGSKDVTLGPGESIARVLWQYVPELENVPLSSGYIRLTADTGVASFAIYGSSRALTAVPPQEIR
jgi:hypothetical protein